MSWRFLHLVMLLATQLRSEETSLRCEGGLEGLLPEDFFERFTLFQSRYNRDNLQRSKEFFYTIYLPKLAPHLDEAVKKCAVPVLELLMNCVLATDADYPPWEARELYEDTMRLARDGQSDPAIQEMLQRWKFDTVHTYPLLMGLTSNSCYDSSLKVYIYDVPESLVSTPVQCAHGQWGTEVLFHRFFMSSACRTLDPSEADFFYVPVYGTCMSVRNDIKGDKQAAKIIWDPLVLFLDSMPWFRRRGQRDHIFLFADGQSARIWDSYDLVRGEAIFMMVESKCPTWDEPMRRYTDIKSCSSSWKDILIPGHTDHMRAHQMRISNKPSEERDLLMTFHGRHPESHDVYASCEVRRRVMALGDFEGVDVGGFVDNYLELKGRAHFCLIPGGTSPWTNHLYESFFCGCIPVILSDEYEVAFQDQLNWPSFSIKWPEAEVGELLYDFLRSFTAHELHAMKGEVDRHSCWFDYFSETPDCSPYLAALRTLEERKRRFPANHGRFWNAAPALAKAIDGIPRRTTRFHVSAEGDEQFML